MQERLMKSESQQSPPSHTTSVVAESAAPCSWLSFSVPSSFGR